MPTFSDKSHQILFDADPDIQGLLFELIKHIDFKVLCSYRNKAAQDEAYMKGNSTLRWPHSKHNKLPSLAIDIEPYFKEQPHERLNDRESFVYLAGHLMMLAKLRGVALRWGNDWDRDDDLTDNTFDDLFHFEKSL
jgi:peptidoglycan L-alanyl-D-glutamate endopeptidase CwlK